MQSPFCFPALSERVVILTWTDDAADPQTARSAAAFAMLKEERDACGRPFKVHKMPQPGPLRITQTESATIDASPGMTRAAGSRLAGSYVNFLITNGLVVMPSLDARTDDDALCLMASIFPHHRVLGVPSQSPQSTILWHPPPWFNCHVGGCVSSAIIGLVKARPLVPLSWS
jgi:agmatine/peptidylarginine deiminase